MKGDWRIFFLQSLEKKIAILVLVGSVFLGLSVFFFFSLLVDRVRDWEKERLKMGKIKWGYMWIEHPYRKVNKLAGDWGERFCISDIPFLEKTDARCLFIEDESKKG